ncbi:MAG: mechanosensitive ion channel [Planctomycetes bacterium]|nr:mechanosensitive ion channel [Planctomycetota bacterium]
MSRFLLFLSLLVGTVALRVPAQTPPAQDPAAEISVAALQARIDAVNADTALAPEAKAPLLEALGRAIESARATESKQQAIARYADLRASAADRLQRRRGELQALDGRQPGPPRRDLDLADLEQGLAAAQQAQADAQKMAVDVETERSRRAERRTAIPTSTAEWKARLDALPTQPADAPGVDPRLVNARRLALLAERLRLQAEIDALTAELQTYDAEADLLRTESDLAARKATVAKADADAWLEVLQPMRAAAAQQAKEAAQQTVEEVSDDRLKNLAAGNAELAAAAATLAEHRQRAESEQSDRDQDLLRLQQDFDETRKRADLVGPTDAVGALLRNRRTQLAETNRKHQQRKRNRGDRIADAQLQSFEYDERRRRLVENPESWLLQQLGVESGAALPANVLGEARLLRDARRDLLQQLTDGYSNLLDTELKVQSIEDRLTQLIASYRAYVTERVLGIRSSDPIWQLDWTMAANGIVWLADPVEWAEVGRLLFASIVVPVWPLALAVPLLVLLALRRLLGRRLVLHGERAARGSNVAYLPTALAAIDTALLAVPLPGLLLLAGWRLAANPECTDCAKAVAAGAEQTSWALLLVLSLASLVRARGLAEAHFQWQSTTIAHLRRAIPLLLLSVLPFSFLLATLEVRGDDRIIGSLGSLLLIGQLLPLLVAFARLLHPTTGIVGSRVQKASALYRFRRLWHWLGVGMPLAFLVMVGFGYDYTVLQLARRLHVTVAVLVAGVFVHAMIVRSLLLERRRLQIRKAQERMQATKAGDGGQGSPDSTALAEIDPQSLARRTQTLLRGVITIVVAVVAFQVWIDVLPALGALRTVTVWPATGTDAAVTLADLLWGLFLLLAALVAARNLPALLELFVLQRLRMQAGERHAVTTLARYGILIVGLVWSFSSVGIGWSKVQWLVAAVSVGLGFGLQEIFANFVSGLILLFERPIRIGDLVTVGTTTGRVTRIRIRATTVQDWDRKELIVPNREFVTNQVVNWTLGDSIVRWTFPVGIAYGSDTDKALALLEQVARSSRFVVADPAPQAVFVGFGDSTLDLKLWLFVDQNTLEYRWMTDIYLAIDRAFREAGIEIAFPQRDVHLKLSEQLTALLQQRRPGP